MVHLCSSRAVHVWEMVVWSGLGVDWFASIISSLEGSSVYVEGWWS